MPENWHQALPELSVLKAEIAEVRERVAELEIAAQEQSLDRGISRGRGRGRLRHQFPAVFAGNYCRRWQVRRSDLLQAGYRQRVLD